jgi:hypothetical protein
MRKDAPGFLFELISYRGAPKESGVEGVTGPVKAAPVDGVAGGIGGTGGKLGPAIAPGVNDWPPGCGAVTPP